MINQTICDIIFLVVISLKESNYPDLSWWENKHRKSGIWSEFLTRNIQIFYKFWTPHLLRYGERHNLTHLLYKYRSSTEYNSLKEERLIKNTLTPNIFAQHAQFNPEFLRNHLKDNLKFFTIIREPVSQFLSAFSFFEKTKIYPADTFDDSVTQFLNLHQTYLTTSRFCKDCNKVANANGVDMGFDIGEYMLADNKDQFVR